MKYCYRPISLNKILKILILPSAGEDIKQQEFSLLLEGCKWYSHSGRQFGSFPLNLTFTFHMTQQSHILV